jgi:type II secretory pathway component PulM
MNQLTPRERKLAAIGLAVAALALVWLAVIGPLLLGFAERASQRERLIAQYLQNERMIARTSALRRAAEKQAQGAADFVVSARDADAAAELLKTRLADSLTRAGGELRASEGVEAQPGWVRASVSGVVSYPHLVVWLDRLSNEPPYLVVESLSVAADRAINSNHLDLMDVQLEASIPLAPAHAR